jgi:Protein kinase domain
VIFASLPLGVDPRGWERSRRASFLGISMTNATPKQDISDFEKLAAHWTKLRRRFAPKRAGIWAHKSGPSLSARQGWKLHLSATVLSANDLLQRCGELLLRSGFQFKMAATLVEISKLNSGSHYGRSQVGKVVTVYLPDATDATRLAEQLHQKIGSLPCPEVPSDRRYKPGSNVFYRYGGYDKTRMRKAGKMVLAYRDPAGNLVPDMRTAATAVPKWLQDPFRVTAAVSKRELNKRSARTHPRYRAVAAIRWRGAGGIYRALDMRVRPPRRCIMKEGLRHGSPSCDGVDGFKAVRNEADVLTSLRARNVRVPRVHGLFYQRGNSYLVQDLIEGKTLAELVDGQRLSLRKKTRIACQICDVVSSIHAAGWAWRDIKLGNFLYDGRNVWAIDLETGMPIRSRRPRSFRGTPGHYLELPDPITGQQALLVDRYALGVTLQRLFGGASERSTRYRKRLPATPKKIHPGIARLVKDLRDRKPERRPSAAEALKVLVQSMP